MDINLWPKWVQSIVPLPNFINTKHNLRFKMFLIQVFYVSVEISQMNYIEMVDQIRSGSIRAD